MNQWIADGLRKLATWVDGDAKGPGYATQKSVESGFAVLTQACDDLTDTLTTHGTEIEKLKKQIENLSLLTGFSRGMQTPGGRK